MGFEILGSDGVTVLKVDTTSQAAHVTLYDQYGNPMSDVTSLANVLNALNSAVTITLGGQATIGWSVDSTSGTITLTFEGTVDGGTSWQAINAWTIAGAAVTSTTGNGQWWASTSGFSGVRARVSAITGGASMTVSAVATPGSSSIVGVAVTGTITANQGAPNTLANAWSVEITDGTNVLGTSSHPVRVDPTGTTTQPVSAASLPLPTGAATAANQTTIGTQTTELNDGTNTIGTSSHPVRVDPTGTTTQPVSGTVTVQQATAANLLATVTQGAPNTAANKWPVSLTDGTNTTAVKAASTAAVAADPSEVVALSPNSPLYDGNGNTVEVKNRIAMPTTQGGQPVAGLDVGLMNRFMRVGEIGTVRTTSEIQLWHDAFEGSTVNAFWTQSTTTMTIAQATGVLTLNNSAITTLNTDAIITSQRQFPKYPKVGLHSRYKANITGNSATAHTFAEFGFGAPSGVTAIINNGAFFRFTAAGNLVGVVSYNGTETVSATLLAQGSISTTSYYRFDIFVEDQFARFIVTDANDIPVVDSQLQIALTDPSIWSVSHLPTFARVYTDATGGGTTTQLKIAAHNVQMSDALVSKPWNDQSASSMRVPGVNPTSYATTVSSFTAAPSTLTPANASAGYATLGGEYAFATVVGFETGASIFGFQIPSPYTFYLTGIQIPAPVVATTIGVTGIPYIEWLIAWNATTNLLSTGGGFRQGCGIVHAAPTASAAQGTVWNGGLGSWNPKTPIPCLPGTFLHIGFKILGTTVATTPGLMRGAVTVDGYFE